MYLFNYELSSSDFIHYDLSTELRREETAIHTTPHHETHANPKTPPANIKTRYIWIGGDDTTEYMRSASTWKAHTSTDQFAAKFSAISDEYHDDNETRT